MTLDPTSPCPERVGKRTVTFACTLPSGHDGPHLAIEDEPSKSARARWLREEAHRKSGLGEFQGLPQTTAERYTLNPSPLPSSADVRPSRDGDTVFEAHGVRLAEVDGGFTMTTEDGAHPVQPSNGVPRQDDTQALYAQVEEVLEFGGVPLDRCGEVAERVISLAAAFFVTQINETVRVE